MRIKFYVNRRKFYETMRYSLKQDFGDHLGGKELVKYWLNRGRGFRGVYLWLSEHININLPELYHGDGNGELIDSIFGTTLHETLHHLLRGEIAQGNWVAQHNIIYLIEDFMFPNTLPNHVRESYVESYVRVVGIER